MAKITTLRKPVEEEIDVMAVLAGAAKPKEAASSKSKTPILSVGDPIKKLATRARALTAEIESRQSEMELVKQELIDQVAPLRAGLCKKEGYLSTVRVPDTEGLSISLTWSGSYSKIDDVPAVKKVVGERFDELFITTNVINVKGDASNALLKELITAVGPERFAEFFDVTQAVKPNERYTKEFFSFLTDDERALLSPMVPQYKPSIKTK